MQSITWPPLKLSFCYRQHSIAPHIQQLFLHESEVLNKTITPVFHKAFLSVSQLQRKLDYLGQRTVTVRHLFQHESEPNSNTQHFAMVCNLLQRTQQYPSNVTVSLPSFTKLLCQQQSVACNYALRSSEQSWLLIRWAYSKHEALYTYCTCAHAYWHVL